ncbi:hypothetical protein AB0G73_27805 [Streptomyces sp. NPDC020719]|uniref:hypothetical protein n=1 Tax=Streptomyces sp. NPDC020719 TaxID=3154896 RepID=UPI00340C86C9
MVISDLPAITRVWSSFGHCFYGDGGCDGHDDGSSCETCMTCGAVYELCRRADDPSGGDYRAADGDDPIECTGDIGMRHGEQSWRADSGRPCTDSVGLCPHESHACNCLLCTG